MSGNLRRGAQIALNLAIAGLTLYAWIRMTIGWGLATTVLSSRGLSNLRFFTVLSNLFSGAASAACLVHLVRRPGSPLPDRLLGTKFVATVGVALTFVVVIAFLGPLYGHDKMYQGANLWFHLILPIAAVVDLIALEADRPLAMRICHLSVVPMALYGAWYYARILLYGPGEGPDAIDFYGFVRMGVSVAPLVFLGMALTTWAIACALRFACNLRCRRHPKRT